MKNNVYFCLLAGGKGTRLWPLSTETCSKSFIKIGNRKPLIEESIKRIKGFATKNQMIAVVDKAQEKIANKFLKGIPRKNILIEPFGRSTASAVGLAAINLRPEDTLIVLPTDSLIENVKSFRETLKNAINFVSVNEDALTCIGVKPRSASTAYGYLRIGPEKGKKVFTIDKFIEKPSKEKAKKLIKKNTNLWNAGIFIFKVKAILKAIKTHAPVLSRELERIKKNKKDINKAYSRMHNVSIDYQIMERANNLFCIKGDFTWCDLGNWVNVANLFKKDKNKNASFGKVKFLDTKNLFVYNATKKTVNAIGITDSVMVATEDGVLLSRKEDVEKVKRLAAI
jgi:mannose-1-phosphate guanylyltransferase